MAAIFNGRYTAKTDQPFVVFLIGLRVNKWWRFDKWIPVAAAMGPMLQTLFTHPEKGFLHTEFFWNFNGPVLIQYWRSFEDLERFARHPSDPHLKAWKNLIRQLARMEVLASGMRLILSTQINLKVCMPICPSSVSPQRWSTSKQLVDAKQHARDSIQIELMNL